MRLLSIKAHPPSGSIYAYHHHEGVKPLPVLRNKHKGPCLMVRFLLFTLLILTYSTTLPRVKISCDHFCSGHIYVLCLGRKKVSSGPYNSIYMSCLAISCRRPYDQLRLIFSQDNYKESTVAIKPVKQY